MQAQHPSGSEAEAITNAFAVGEVLKPEGLSYDVKSYSVPGLVESDLNPTQRFVTLADFDTLQHEVERLSRFRESIKGLCENPKNRGRRTQLQMCRFLDELRLTAIRAGSDEKWGTA